jgi:bacterioferritin-associated ferredoxin
MILSHPSQVTRARNAVLRGTGRQTDDLLCLAFPNHFVEGNEAMYVCICRAVTETMVRGCIAEGARTVKDVVIRSEAGTGCGTCVSKIIALLGAHTDELDSALRHHARL